MRNVFLNRETRFFYFKTLTLQSLTRYTKVKLNRFCFQDVFKQNEKIELEERR